MMNLSNQELKSNLRKEILNKRNSLSQLQIYNKSKLIQRSLIRTSEFIESKTIGLYIPIGSEVETWDMINYVLKSGRILLLPRIVNNNIRYFIVEQNDFDTDSFDTNRFRIKEPKKTNGSVDFIDLLIIPGIAFDSYGYRIGYGYGYYDKFLAKKKFSKCIGLAYDFQLIKIRIPKFAYDRKIDMLITERRTHIVNAF
jgi:5-formyltetrahydrofolate cyclo-ligase